MTRLMFILLIVLSSCASAEKLPKQKEVKIWNYRTPKENKPVTPTQQLVMMIVGYSLVSLVIVMLQM